MCICLISCIETDTDLYTCVWMRMFIPTIRSCLYVRFRFMSIYSYMGLYMGCTLSGRSQLHEHMRGFTCACLHKKGPCTCMVCTWATKRFLYPCISLPLGPMYVPNRYLDPVGYASRQAAQSLSTRQPWPLHLVAST